MILKSILGSSSAGLVGGYLGDFIRLVSGPGAGFSEVPGTLDLSLFFRSLQGFFVSSWSLRVIPPVGAA